MSRIPTASFWVEPRAARAGIAMSAVYPATAGGRWYLSSTSTDQAATVALKDSRIFLDTDVTDGGRLGLSGNNRVAIITIPASTI